MKQKPKKGFRSVTRNLYLFGALLHKEKGFLRDLRALQKRIRSAGQFTIPELQRYFWIEFTGKEEVGLKVRKFLSRHLENDRFNEVWDEIKKILLKYDLGQEWEDTLWIYIVSNKVFPPLYNFHLFEHLPGGRRYGDSRVGIILNPDTSIRDLMEAWPKINKLQRSYWVGFKKKNLTKSSFKFLLDDIAILQKKSNISDKERYSELSWYETALAKQGKFKEILKYQKTSDRSGGKIKNKRTDSEAIALLLGPKTPHKKLKQNIGKYRKRRERL